jgi:hypothetical protein
MLKGQLDLFDQVKERKKLRSGQYARCVTPGCGNLQSHREGKCVECRTIPCVECKKAYVRRKGLPRCPECNRRHRSRLKTWD